MYFTKILNLIYSKYTPLFFFKGAERFSYFALKANSLMYLCSVEGFGMSSIEGTHLIANIARYSLILSVIIGLFCDIIGQKKSLIIGIICLVIGHYMTHIHNLKIFVISSFLIMCAASFLRSSVIAILSKITTKDKIDSVMSSFYWSFNLGAFLGQLTVGYVGEYFGWKKALLYILFVVLLGLVIGFMGSKQALQALDDNNKLNNNNEQNSTENNHAIFSKKGLHGILLFIIMQYMFFYYSILEAMDSHLLPGWMKDYGNSYLFNILIPTSAITSINPLSVLVLSNIVSIIRNKLKERGWFKSDFRWSSIALIPMLLCGTALAIAEFEKNFYGKSSPIGLMLFIFFLVLGEITFYPTILSSISKLVPNRLYGTALALMPLVSIGSNFISELLATNALSTGNMKCTILTIYGLSILGIVVNEIGHRLSIGFVKE
ncbi:di-/tripeptide transporter [uncultured bacterium]|nr:di-/tripeptide transporter [uncultured bacterium]